MAPFGPRRVPVDWTADDEALLQAVDDATATPILVETADRRARLQTLDLRPLDFLADLD